MVERGPNLVSPQLPEPLDDDFAARVLISVGDDVSTGDMAPDGAIAMSVWSNIALCARFMFARFDPAFHDRAVEWGGGVIVAGDNYGQGSSREHAALIPVHLGIRVIAARSYARIHRRNLIATGIVPLIRTDSGDGASGNTSSEEILFATRPEWFAPQTLAHMVEIAEKLLAELGEPLRSKTVQGARSEGKAFEWVI